MARDRLQRVAAAGPDMAVIDDQCGPALACKATGELGDESERGGRCLALHLAVAHEPLVLERDPKLAPVRGELADRQRVEKFIGDGEQRAVLGERGEIVMPARGEPLSLGDAERGAGLDQLDRRRQPGAAHRPQRILGERAAAGAKLDIISARGPPGAVPKVGEPDPDQLAEHLADLRRGDEIPGRAERIAASIIKAHSPRPYNRRR